MGNGLLQKFKERLQRKRKPDDGLSIKPDGLFSPRYVMGTADIEAYRKMRRDGQVSAALSVIKLPVISRQYSVEASSDAIAEFVKSALSPIYRDLMNKALNAVDFGFAPLELVWQIRDDGYAAIEHVKDPDVGSISIKADDFGKFHGLSQHPDKSIEPPRTFLFTIGGENGNYYGQSRLVAAHPHWRTREIVYLFLNRYLERKGNPPVVVTYPPAVQNSKTDDNSRAALDVGKQLLENSAIAIPHIPDGYGKSTWSVDYLQDTPRAEMFLKYIEHLDKMILRSLFVPEHIISNDGSSGSYAQSKVHADMFLLGEDGLIADIESAINRQVITPLVEMNFGRDASAKLSIGRLTGSDRQLAEDVFMEMIKRGDAQPLIEPLAQTLGVAVDKPA